jgi:seryl-tRNA synthetase
MKRDMMDRMGRYNPNDTTYELKLDDMVLIASAEHSL